MVGQTVPDDRGWERQTGSSADIDMKCRRRQGEGFEGAIACVDK
jgi:hypothetical protein